MTNLCIHDSRYCKKYPTDKTGLHHKFAVRILRLSLKNNICMSLLPKFLSQFDYLKH